MTRIITRIRACYGCYYDWCHGIAMVAAMIIAMVATMVVAMVATMIVAMVSAMRKRSDNNNDNHNHDRAEW